MTPLYLARSITLPDGAEAGVQMFPPGTMKLSPTNSATGKAEEIELTIDEATAATLEAARAAMQAAADRNEGDAPFLDFNHDDREAAAWVRRIYWAGDDPATGGVRAEVEWSAAGRDAVAGRTFRRFSPAFHAEGGRVTGAPVNMGGLVNRAAISRIQPLFAKDSDQPKTTKTMMTDEEATALREENAALKTQLAELQTSLEAMQKKDAEATVAHAAKEGRIAAAPEMQAKWVAAILHDPAAKDLLLAMAPNPALAGKSVVTSGAADTSDETPAALLAKYNDLPRDEKQTFFAAHKRQLIAAREAVIRSK